MVDFAKKYNLIEEAKKIKLVIENEINYIAQVSVEETKIHDMWDLVSGYNSKKIKFVSLPIYESVLFDELIIETIERQYQKDYKVFSLCYTLRYLIKKANADKNFRIDTRSRYFLTEHFKKHPEQDENPRLKTFGEIIKLKEQLDHFTVSMSCVLRLSNGANDNIKYPIEELEYYNKNHMLDENLIEFGGHIRFNNFNSFIKLLNNRKVSPMESLISDATSGYDHITNIIGQHLFALLYKNIAGLLVITPPEHLYLQTLENDKITTEYAKIVQHEIGLMYEDPECLRVEDEFNKKPISCNIRRNLFGEIKGLKPCDMCGENCALEE